MDENKSYRRFKLIFHSFIFIFAIGVIIASIAGWNEMNRALLYLILGIIFATESIFGFYKNFRQRLAQ
ncbi:MULTISPECIES: hypothetical protein [Salimicrobium]|uniref:Uncharacterized protein n=1 Tax=Salimicrobium humidisoli TaxID=2029857 RepID=A0ABX4HPF9_9BACI|nr:MULTISPECIES: hypothetical protein [Salimicrobium]PBB04600.1 hypothetical protein CKW00_13205 [Salimicrobium humidisoli]